MADQKSSEKTGILFTEQNHFTDKSPDFRGNCTIDGKSYEIAGWWKSPKSGKGEKFISMAFKPK